MSDHVQLRRKGGLHTIKSKAGIVAPKIYHQDVFDPTSDGAYVGDYRGQSILKTRQHVCPTWEEYTSQWAWSSTPQKLCELVNKMKLRYPENHDKKGQLITCKDTNEAAEMLTYRSDPVFTHKELYGYFLEDARLTLNMKDPKQEFLFYCLKGSSIVSDRSDNTERSGFETAAMQYELVSPKDEVRRKREDVKKETKAFVLFDAMDGNEEKMRAIAEVMQLPGYSPKMDINALYVLIRDMAVTNTEISPKYDKSYMDRFIELASIDSEKLAVQFDVIKAKRTMALVQRAGYYMFKGKKLENISNDVQLIDYFLNENNQEDYMLLLEELGK